MGISRRGDVVEQRIWLMIGIVLLVSSVRTIAEAFKALEKVNAKLKIVNEIPKPKGGKNGHANGHSHGSAKKLN